MIITIDGPVATGKSTIAKHLAKSLGYTYFDTGAMYRCLTWGLLENRVDYDDPEALKSFFETFEFDIKIKRGERRYCVANRDITTEIRKDYVTERVSEISALPAVREKLVSIQRHLAKGINAVFEGRDMGTVVFPDAPLKIFLTGKPEIRAKRRYEELIEKFPEMKGVLTLEKCLEDINKRDLSDSTREISPLKQAPDACVIDTSDLNQDEVVMEILEFKDRLKN